AEIGNRDDAGASAGEVGDDRKIRAVDTQHELRAGADGRTDFAAVERVHADTQAGGDELAHDVAEHREREARRTADVDEIRAGRAEVLCRRPNLGARQLRRIVDLGDDLDVPRAVVGRGSRASEVAGNLPKVLRAFLHRHMELVADRARVAL